MTTKLSELLSKPVISIFDAKTIGTIGNIYFDKKMSKGVILSVFSDEDGEAEEKYIELTRLERIDHHAAVIKSSDCVSYSWNTTLGSPNPINHEAYTQDGKLLGVVRDIILEGTKISKFIIDENEFAAGLLLSHSEKMLVFNDSGKPIKIPPKKRISNPKSAAPRKIELHYGNITNDRTTLIVDGRKTQEHSVQRHDNQTTAYNAGEPASSESISNPFAPEYVQQIFDGTTIMQKDKEYPKNGLSAPLKAAVKAILQPPSENIRNEQKNGATEEISIDLPLRIPQSSTTVSRTPAKEGTESGTFNFLIGRLLQKNIYASTGAVIAREHARITAEIITTCKTEGKLVQLALHSVCV